MNKFFNDDIVLTKEDSINLLNSLKTVDDAYLSIRNKYFEEIKDSLFFEEKGDDLIVEVSDLDLTDLCSKIIIDDSVLLDDSEINYRMNLTLEYVSVSELLNQYPECDFSETKEYVCEEDTIEYKEYRTSSKAA